MKRMVSSLFVFLLVFSILSCARKSSQTDNVRSSLPISGGIAEKSISQDTSLHENVNLSPGAQIPEQKSRKIIQNAAVRISVEAPEKAMEEISKEVEKLKGYIANSNKTVYTNGISANLQIKIPAISLKPFLKFLQTLGKEDSEVISTNEITKEYYDTKARLENAINQKKQFELILAKAQKITDLLEVQRQIDSVQERIEQFKGQIELWDQLVDLSTVDIDIRQTEKTQTVEKKPIWNPLSAKQLGIVIKNTWISFANVIVNIFQFILIVLPILLTLLILFILIYWVIIKCIKFGKKFFPKK